MKSFYTEKATTETFQFQQKEIIFYKKDISILARSGFTYELSKKVLDITKEEFNKFCKLI